MDLKFVADLGVEYFNPTPAQLLHYTFRISVQDDIDPSMGYANVLPDTNQHVEGVLMQISTDALAKLDEYEGYPELYDRQMLTVYPANAKNAVQAWVYLGTPKYTTTSNLQLSELQKTRIRNGFPFLSLTYQAFLEKIVVDKAL